MSPAPPPHLRPFATAQRPSNVAFIGLNALRALSIIAMLLVFISNVVTIVGDVNAMKAAKHTNEVTSTVSTTSSTMHSRAAEFNSTVATSSNNTWTCNYMQHSTIPSQTGGPFWSILNRVFILCETLVLLLSEVGFPRTLFDIYIPMLSKAYGLGCLGVLQAFLAASALSHYANLFPQVSSWMLFIIGCLNILVGIFLREKARAQRSLFKWENYANLTPQTKVAAGAWDVYNGMKEPSPTATPSKAEKGGDSDEEPYVPGSRFGGLAFGAQKAWRNSLQTLKISRPLETLPKHHM